MFYYESNWMRKYNLLVELYKQINRSNCNDTMKDMSIYELGSMNKGSAEGMINWVRKGFNY